MVIYVDEWGKKNSSTTIDEKLNLVTGVTWIDPLNTLQEGALISWLVQQIVL